MSVMDLLSPESTPPSEHQALKDRVNEFTHENATSQDRLEKAEYHCQMAVMEVEALHKRLDLKILHKGKGCAVVTDLRCFTSGEGLIAWRAQEAERKAKQNEKDELHRQEQSKTMVFSGNLLSKYKPDLQDIVATLHLLTDVTKVVLTDTIKAHLESQTAL
ncbi:hypothetical protein WOLCODRAFT_18717 [Wolfiporia cocos MD-104 SS10]|uniref:Uncharacterized protein n=1 Tax=Wolfiporia cocos (strain MD-104) TaxID=742152 RepID=A0A2H3K4U0_WOLCO|nr:hypothetical protein WOLCODRAFT_18717 [Wolfiporia cocos MD-104 SS10]